MVKPFLALSFFSFSLILGSVSFAQLPKSTPVDRDFLQPRKLDCKFISPIEQVYLVSHPLVPSADELNKRIVDQYIKHLDPLKIYFLASDIPTLKQYLNGITDKTRNRDCTPFLKSQDLFQTRVSERLEYVKKLLGKKFVFDSKVQFEYDPQKREFPATKAISEDFLGKYVQFQISNYLAADTKLPEAKKNVIKLWERTYKRVKETKTEDILASYLDSFGGSLDPHSSFFSKESNEDFRISMGLSLQGIGATLSSQDGFTVIEALVPGGAAAKSGKLQPQDKIMSVGQGDSGKMEPVYDMDLREVVRKIRGNKGTKVRLSIMRKEGDGKSRFEVLLVRDEIKLEDEAAKLTVIDKETSPGKKLKLGVIMLPSFYASNKKGGRSAAVDLKKVIAEAKEKKVDGLVFDVSGNPGGSLDDAVKITGLFFQTGNVVKQRARDDGKNEIVLKDQDPAVDWAGPLVVLTSRASASASEIVAGTLKDYKRAVVVGGDHTFGKGSVQSVIDIPPGDGSLGAVKVTVGMFYTPGGFSTQHRGVDGDIVLPSILAQDEIGEKSLDYSLPPKQITPFLSTEAYVKEGPSAWKQISEATIKTLAEKSKARVAADPEFKKISEELEKLKKQGKLIKVGDAVKDKEKKDKAKNLKTLSREAKDKEYLKRPDVQESLNILADLIGMS